MSGTTSADLAWKSPTQPCGTRGSLPGSEMTTGSWRRTASRRNEGISSSARARRVSAPSAPRAAPARSASCELTGTMSWPDLSRRKIEPRSTRHARAAPCAMTSNSAFCSIAEPMASVTSSIRSVSSARCFTALRASRSCSVVRCSSWVRCTERCEVELASDIVRRWLRQAAGRRIRQRIPPVPSAMFQASTLQRSWAWSMRSGAWESSTTPTTRAAPGP